MISRRLLRIKALMALYAFNRREDGDLARAESELMFSIEKTYDLYHYLMLLIIDIADIALGKIDFGLQKKMPTPEDLNPNRRFVDNKLIARLRSNEDLENYQASHKLSWAIHPHIPRTVFGKMTEWPVYNEYINSDDHSFTNDRKFIVRLVSEFFLQSEDLAASLEEQSIYWNDDLEYVITMLEKTLKKFKADTSVQVSLLPLFKNEDDSDFVKLLFRKAVIRAEAFSELIEKNTTNWEVDRIALMDILVMRLALTEITEFPEIPVKVTLNEYIEIAKFYCTSKSSTFVNGILDNIVREIREKGLFNKSGRGLVGEAFETGN